MIDTERLPIVANRINVYHGRSYRNRQPLCETPDCPNVGTNTSEEYGNDGKHWADVLRCDSCYLIAQSKVRKMKGDNEAMSHREQERQRILKKCLELGKTLLTAEELGKL